ncbi:MAG: hypothetical protein LBJ26_07000 [Paenibacillus sp.]|nr:hypothetical protein [Paenibacillus sp.]
MRTSRRTHSNIYISRENAAECGLCAVEDVGGHTIMREERLLSLPGGAGMILRFGCLGWVPSRVSV